MKKLITCLLLIITCQSFAQVSDTLLPNLGGEWSMVHWQYDGESVDMQGYYYSFTDGIYGPMDWNGTTWTYFITNDGIEGLMRSDSGKVYCRGLYAELPYTYAPVDTSEKLLYDFTMEVGDTAYFDGPSSPVTVESIGISTLLGVPKKAWFLTDNETIIQGLGSSKGLFRPWIQFFESDEWICSFYGAYEDSTGLVTDLSFSTSACELAIDEQQGVPIHVVFQQDQLLISSVENTQMQIFGMDGKLICSMPVESGEQVFHTSFLQSGVFLLRIGGTYVQKFVHSN